MCPLLHFGYILIILHVAKIVSEHLSHDFLPATRLSSPLHVTDGFLSSVLDGIGLAPGRARSHQPQCSE